MFASPNLRQPVTGILSPLAPTSPKPSSKLPLL